MKPGRQHPTCNTPFPKARKAILLSLFALLPLLLKAQPVLTLAGMIPPDGSTIRYYDNNLGYTTQLPLPGNAGANRSWDFSSYTTTGTVELTYSSGPGGFRSVDWSNHIRNYRINGNAISLESANCDVYRMYGDQDDLFRFPMTLGTKYADSFYISGTINYPQIRSVAIAGVDSVEADAWGTVVTPAGTYTNTLRVKRVQIFRETSTPPSGLGNHQVVTYTWYSPGNPNFVYRLSDNTSGYGICEHYTFAYPAGALAIPAQQLQDVSWSVFPNPAKDAFQLRISLNGAASVSGAILDMAGRTLQVIPERPLTAGSSEIPCDASSLPPGIYLIRIAVNGLVSTKSQLFEVFR